MSCSKTNNESYIDVENAATKTTKIHHRRRPKAQKTQIGVPLLPEIPKWDKLSWKGFNNALPELSSITFQGRLLKNVSPSYFAQTLGRSLSLSIQHQIQYIRNNRNNPRVVCRLILISLLVGLLVVSLTIFLSAKRMCTPSRDYIHDKKPFVEYYVHGRGMGHLTRSVAIVRALNEAGVDVRLFVPTVAFWQAHERVNTRGSTTPILITSVTPEENLVSAVLHSIRRLYTDCKVAMDTNRYPHLVIADGDMPGMLRAKFGGIPNVALAHGQLFNIAKKPTYIQEHPQLNAAWNQEYLKNRLAGWFSKWTIATHFCYLESNEGLLAHAPLRPAVTAMSKARQDLPDSLKDLPRSEEIKKLITGHSRRKLVVCYFRDKNGQAVTDQLQKAGFDVLVMAPGPKDGIKVNHQQLGNGLPRSILVPDLEMFLPLLRVADGVASSAGSQLMTECIHSQVPLLAFYKENDYEQHLNVELSRLCPKKPLVFGTSFESLLESMSKNDTEDQAMKEINQFIEIVKKSRISDMYYDYLDGVQSTFDAAHSEDIIDTQMFPDAVDIVLDIINEVQHGY